MEKICNKYDISQKDGLFNLEDIVKNIICSKNVKKYINKVTGKILQDEEYYVNETKFVDMMKRGKSKICKKIKKIIDLTEIMKDKDTNIDFDNYESIDLVDLDNDIFVLWVLRCW